MHSTRGRAMTVRLASAVVLLTLLLGCSRKISDRDLVIISSAEASRLTEDGTGLLGMRKQSVFLDPRIPRNYSEGHIPDAINIPFSEISRRYETLRPYRVIVVYGNDYNDLKANAMSKRLLDLGLSDVRTLRGGLEAWVTAGNPIVVED